MLCETESNISQHFLFQLTASFDEDPQSMQGFVLSSSFQGRQKGQLSTDQYRRELVVENIEESNEVNRFLNSLYRSALLKSFLLCCINISLSNTMHIYILRPTIGIYQPNSLETNWTRMVVFSISPYGIHQ